MTSTTIPLVYHDVDFQLDSSGEVFRAKTISFNNQTSRIDHEKMGSQEIDFGPGSNIRDWTITIDEISGNYNTFLTWKGGTNTHTLNISKGAATMALADAKLFGLDFSATVGSANSLVLTGTTSGVTEA